MKQNQPYVKQFDSQGVLLNEITLTNPHLNNNPSNRSKLRSAHKYIVLNGMKLKVGGNNRKPCKRTGKSRVEHLLN